MEGRHADCSRLISSAEDSRSKYETYIIVIADTSRVRDKVTGPLSDRQAAAFELDSKGDVHWPQKNRDSNVKGPSTLQMSEYCELRHPNEYLEKSKKRVSGRERVVSHFDPGRVRLCCVTLKVGAEYFNLSSKSSTFNPDSCTDCKYSAPFPNP